MSFLAETFVETCCKKCSFSVSLAFPYEKGKIRIRTILPPTQFLKKEKKYEIRKDLMYWYIINSPIVCCSTRLKDTQNESFPQHTFYRSSYYNNYWVSAVCVCESWKSSSRSISDLFFGIIKLSFLPSKSLLRINFHEQYDLLKLEVSPRIKQMLMIQRNFPADTFSDFLPHYSIFTIRNFLLVCI